MRVKKFLFYFCFLFYQLMILCQIYLHRYKVGNFWGMVSSLIIFAAIACIVFSFFSLVKEIQLNAKAEVDLYILRQQEELQSKQTQLLQHRKKDTLCFQKEILDSLEQLQAYLQEKDIDNGQLCFQQLTENFQHVRFRPCCSDSLISAILDSKKKAAFEDGIQVTYQIILPRECEMIHTSLNTIFFNLLDNGIEACRRQKASHPFIQVTSKISGEFLIIHMINSKSENERFSHNTVKKDALSHGLGLSIIEEITRERDGSCEWIDHGTTFESTVMLRCSSLQETPSETSKGAK